MSSLPGRDLIVSEHFNLFPTWATRTRVRGQVPDLLPQFIQTIICVADDSVVVFTCGCVCWLLFYSNEKQSRLTDQINNSKKLKAHCCFEKWLRLSPWTFFCFIPHSDARGLTLPVLHRLLQPAGAVLQKPSAAAAFHQKVHGAAPPLRP